VLRHRRPGLLAPPTRSAGLHGRCARSRRHRALDCVGAHRGGCTGRRLEPAPSSALELLPRIWRAPIRRPIVAELLLKLHDRRTGRIVDDAKLVLQTLALYRSTGQVCVHCRLRVRRGETRLARNRAELGVRTIDASRSSLHRRLSFELWTGWRLPRSDGARRSAGRSLTMPSKSSTLRAITGDNREAKGPVAAVPNPPQASIEAATLVGVRAPTDRGGTQRFLSDVIVEMGLASPSRSTQRSRRRASTARRPRRCSFEAARSVPTASRRRSRNATASTMSTWRPSTSTWPRRTSSRAGREALRRASDRLPRRPHAARRDVRPGECARDRRHRDLTGFEIRAAVATTYDVANAISRLTRLSDSVATAVEEEDHQHQHAAEVLELHESADDAPVVKLVHQLVAQAVEAGASDLHIMPDGTDLRVRFRIDGVLRDITTVPRRMAAGVVSRVKIMAELDIAERRVRRTAASGCRRSHHGRPCVCHGPDRAR